MDQDGLFMPSEVPSNLVEFVNIRVSAVMISSFLTDEGVLVNCGRKIFLTSSNAK
jgi:hypothetical protein